ncbi:hypothetical protein H072_3872 [Dactylellina haptotyla CBS 200.50]|uniref:Uncharacterized protein n=1 Tax=Dactylellina haptotyla (strain CBS 200.50) TaxID=1284197 RepID=S8AGJ8_DACHA|nr:hypothetical protein H072_3872 [Dactylellina haptotyla CBS 200.50]
MGFKIRALLTFTPFLFHPAICPPPVPSFPSHLAYIPTYPTWMTWAHANAKTLTSVAAQIDAFDQARHICPIGNIPSLPASQGWNFNQPTRHTLTFLIDGLEHLAYEFCQDALPLLTSWNTQSLLNRQRRLAAFFEKFGFADPTDGQNERLALFKVEYIYRYLDQAVKIAHTSRMLFHGIDAFMDSFAPPVYEKTVLYRTALWIDDARWETSPWGVKASYPNTVAINTQARRRWVDKFTGFAKVADRFVSFARDSAAWAEDNGLLSDAFTAVLQPHMHDPDFGTGWGRPAFTVVDLFERLWGWYGCWAGPLGNIARLSRQVQPVPGLEMAQMVQVTMEGEEPWTVGDTIDPTEMFMGDRNDDLMATLLAELEEAGVGDLLEYSMKIENGKKEEWAGERENSLIEIEDSEGEENREHYPIQLLVEDEMVPKDEFTDSIVPEPEID